MEIPNLLRDFEHENTFIPIKAIASMDNEFIPVHCLKGSNALEVGCTKTLLYDYYMYTGGTVSTTKFNKFGMDMRRYDGYWHELTHASITKKYISTYGLLVDRTNILQQETLMMLCLKKEYAFTANKANPDPSNFCLVIDRKLIRDEEHFKLYRNLKKSYIDIMEQELDVMYTNNLENVCLKTAPLELPKFKTLTGVMDHYKTINDKLKKVLLPEPTPEVDLPF